MATRIRFIRDEKDDESDDDSQERKFICEICSVATKSKVNLKKLVSLYFERKITRAHA